MLLPRALQHADAWLTPVSPGSAQLQALLQQLHRFLGDDGLLLLSAMSAYPELHWGLTRALDLNLAPGSDPQNCERRLLRIARLPWCREGWLPDWLREHLLEECSKDQRKTIANLYQQLMGLADIDGAGEIALPFDLTRADQSRGLRSWLKRLGQLAPDDSTLQDRIFANALLGNRLRNIDFLLPHGLASHLPAGGLRLLLPRLVLVLLFSVLAGWAADRAWQHWLQQPAIELAQTFQLGDHENYRVQIQRLLDQLGYSPGVLDGIIGPQTRSAIRQFQQNQGVTVDGLADAELLRQLQDTQRVQQANTENELKPVEGSDNQSKLSRPVTTSSPQSPRLIRDKLSDGSPGPEMLVLPAGKLLMGSPEDEPGFTAYDGPQHEVQMPAFAIGRTEVTFEQYDRFAKDTGRKLPDDAGWGRGNRPVIHVSWDDASAYAAWLSKQTGQRYRLPSEAEWEYAARAGTTTPFSTGDCIHTDLANYNGNYDYADCGAKTGYYRAQTVPAASLPANPWGLHEVHGNVWEWVQDCWNDTHAGAPGDGSAREKGGDCALHVVRGGGWTSGPEFLRSADRNGSNTGEAYNDLGFRLARTL